MTHRISFIVSAYNRPKALVLCLQSLILQTFTDWEAFVMDNSDNEAISEAHWAACGVDPRVRYIYTPEGHRDSCYHSSTYGARNLARGEWLSFPSDDSYFVPQYAERMMAVADKNTNLGFLYCDMVWGHDTVHEWMECLPVRGRIDKTNFMVRRDKMPGFNTVDIKLSDGILIEHLVHSGVPHEKVPQPLVVHNQ